MFGKSRHLDNLDAYEWSKGIHNTQVPLHLYTSMYTFRP